MNDIIFDYYRGVEAEQYSFYRIPKMLFTDMVIVNSNNLNNVNRVVAGEEIGTLFLAHKRPDFDFKKYLTERPYFKA